MLACLRRVLSLRLPPPLRTPVRIVALRSGRCGKLGTSHARRARVLWRLRWPVPPAAARGPVRRDHQAYHEIQNDAAFINELRYIRTHFQGRPTPVYHARTLSLENGGAQIYLKREDLNHTGAHKLNHCMGEGLLAKYMGKKKLIAETGAGQHGVALATAAAHFGLECEIHMGQVDIEKQAPNVSRMQLLGATVVPVSTGCARSRRPWTRRSRRTSPTTRTRSTASAPWWGRTRSR